MNDIAEQIDAPQDGAVKPKRHARANKRRRTAVVPKKESPYAGLAPGKCCTACTANKCVISGVNVCANPSLGGLQAALAQGPALDRFKEAKRYLGEQKLDLAHG